MQHNAKPQERQMSVRRSTVNHEITTIKRAFMFAVEQGYLHESPAESLKKTS